MSSKAEFLNKIKEHLINSDSDGRGGDAIRLMDVLVKCQAHAASDERAEMIALGFQLGKYFAAYERKMYADNVQGGRQKAGQATRKAMRDVLGAEIADKYYRLKPSIGCLQARKQIAKDEGIKIRAVNEFLDEQKVKREGRRAIKVV